MLFVRLQTQWRRDAMGLPCGFDYAGVRSAVDMMGKAITPALFEDLQAMEFAAISAIREAQ